MNNTIKTMYVEMDGKTSGFAVYLYSTEKFVTIKSGEKRLFKNINLLKSWMNNMEKEKNPYNYKIYIVISSLEDPIEYNNIQQVFDYYEYHDPASGIDYFIAEDNTERLINVGYLVFEDGDKPLLDINQKEGKRKNNEFINLSKTIAGWLAKRPANGIDSVSWANSFVTSSGIEIGSHLEISIKGASSKIHILKNSELINFNMIRRDMEKRCLPFNKNFDKYKSLYVYTTKSVNDDRNVDKYTEKVLHNIVSEISKMHPDLDARYVPVDISNQQGIFLGGF